MKSLRIGLFAGVVGCTFVQPVSAVEAAKEKVLYSFCSQQNCTDGEVPYAGLIDVKDTLYGTTAFGGAYGAGTVFALDPTTGAEKVLYSFTAGNPTSSLIDVKDTLYGTTYTAGTYGNGTVFSLDPNTGVATVLHSFGGSKDGSNPYTGLIHANGILYGTTEYGGAHGAGTVFALHLKTGAEKVLYSFCSKQQRCADGANPYASLLDVNGTLYGTTKGGGHKRGTVFAVDVNTGAEKVLYAFCSQQKCPDGAYPSAGLISVNGTLYGTTPNGGAYRWGTVFALDPNTDTETVPYSFCGQSNCTDGAYPEAALFAVNDTLYGTTWAGGSSGGGTVFSLDPKAGTETVLHSFSSGGDGQNPGASLIDVNGTLYGTTFAGGTNNGGTVFAIKRR